MTGREGAGERTRDGKTRTCIRKGKRTLHLEGGRCFCGDG